MCAQLLSHVQLFATPWTVACQAPLSMGFSRQEYWSGLPLPSPGDLSNPGIEPGSSALQAEALPSEPPRKPIGINLCFLFSSYVYHLRIYLNNFFQKKTTEQSWACRMMHVPGQFLKSSLTLSLESLMLRRDRNNQEACAELVRLSLAGKTAWGCLAEAIRCLLLSNSVSYEKLKLTLMVEYGCCLSISSPQ